MVGWPGLPQIRKVFPAVKLAITDHYQEVYFQILHSLVCQIKMKIFKNLNQLARFSRARLTRFANSHSD
jgi:hypothetical protein